MRFCTRFVHWRLDNIETSTLLLISIRYIIFICSRYFASIFLSSRCVLVTSLVHMASSLHDRHDLRSLHMSRPVLPPVCSILTLAWYHPLTWPLLVNLVLHLRYVLSFGLFPVHAFISPRILLRFYTSIIHLRNSNQSNKFTPWNIFIVYVCDDSSKHWLIRTIKPVITLCYLPPKPSTHLRRRDPNAFLSLSLVTSAQPPWPP